MDAEIKDNFMRFGNGFLTKYSIRDPTVFLRRIDDFLHDKYLHKALRIFIVHGRDDQTKYELKNFIQNSLKLGEPIILHEQPSLGRTIIEKLEDEASDIDIVFVVLTPDDVGGSASISKSAVRRRARQNVIFELGYFLGKLDRRGRRVLLLYKGDLDLPSDISGVIYIDINNGIDAAGEIIRRELLDVL